MQRILSMGTEGRNPVSTGVLRGTQFDNQIKDLGKIGEGSGRQAPHFLKKVRDAEFFTKIKILEEFARAPRKTHR